MGIECPKCKTENSSDSQFCKNCATPLPSSKEIPATKTLETPTEELTTGSTFAGRYQIIEVLGKGGMGKVYRVLDKELNEEVALKLIKPEIASDKKTLERFSNELKLARKISHKNVGRMYELMEEKGTRYITMEYVPGEDLKRLVRKVGQFSAGKTVSIAKQVCEGLAEAHRLGVVHRDLKPQNIMVDEEGNARILDFGIARTIKGKGITGAGVMVGTPEYMSPEQAEVKEVDQRSDIYSLGVILYEMVTGRVPFEGETPLGIAMKHKSEMPKDPKEINAQIPGDLSRVILKCMEKSKEKRYQSAGEVKSELENVEQGLPTTERVEPKTKPLTSREITVQFNLKKIFIPALVIVVLIATALVFLLKKGPKLESNRVVVTAFLNQTGDSSLDFLGRRAADIVSQGLKAIGTIEVVPIASFDLGKERNVEEKHYRRIAKNTKAAIVIAGEYYLQGENLDFHANIYNANEQKLSPSPEPISGQRVNPSEALERLRNNLMSVVLSIHNPQMETWLTISTYIPKYEALVEFIKGMEFFSRRKYEESIECLDRAIEIDSNYTLALTVAAVAHNNLTRYSVTAQYLEKVKQIPNLSQGERNLRDWLDAHLKGDNESKFRITQQQEKLAPGTSFSYQLGLDAIKTNRPRVAIEALARLDPEGVHMKDWIGYWGVLTSAYHMTGNHKQELKAALKAQKQYPESWRPLSYKIDALAALGNLDEVYKVLEECKAKPMTSNWNPARLMGNAGIEFMAHGYGEEAAEMFEQALSWLRQRPPEEAQSYVKYQLAWAHILTQNLIEAESVLRDLHELNPESLSYLGSLGLVAARKGDREEALRISEQLKEWNKPYLFGSDTFWQAAISAALGEKEQAIVLLRDAISQGRSYSGLCCHILLEPLWDYPAFIELLKLRD